MVYKELRPVSAGLLYMKKDPTQHELALLQALLSDKEKRLTELESTVLTLRQSLRESESIIQSLVEKLNLARRKRYGASSEVMPPQDLEFNEAESHADTEETESDDTQATKQDKGNTSSDSRRGRPKLPEDLPRELVVVDVADSDKICQCCQSALCKMGESTSEKLVYIPAKLYVEVTERPKYVCRECDGDVDGNAYIDVNDLLAVIGDWNCNGGACQGM